MDVYEAIYTTRAMRRQKPDPVPEDVIHVAAFIGKDYGSHLQHLKTAPVPVR